MVVDKADISKVFGVLVVARLKACGVVEVEVVDAVLPRAITVEELLLFVLKPLHRSYPFRVLEFHHSNFLFHLPLPIRPGKN